jgi:hypothetical protein
MGSSVEQGDSFADEWTFAGTRTGPLPLPDGTQLPPTGIHAPAKQTRPDPLDVACANSCGMREFMWLARIPAGSWNMTLNAVNAQ